VLQANRNRGFVADNHYDVSASAKALAAATSAAAFALPELLPSVVLWRALTYSVTRTTRTHVGPEESHTGLDHDMNKQLAETVDQEWRKVSALCTTACHAGPFTFQRICLVVCSCRYWTAGCST
jgi:hypothetical protein